MSAVVCNDISALLAGAGLGLIEGTNLFRKNYPSQLSGVYVSVHDSGGTGPDVTHDAKVIANPDVMVFVHNEDSHGYDTAMTMATSIYNFLAVQANITIDGSFYLRIRPTSNPRPFGRATEDEGWRISFNVRAMRANT